MKKLLLIFLLPIFTFCSRTEFAGNETKEDTIEMETPSSIACNAGIAFTSNYQHIKGLMVGESRRYNTAPNAIPFKVLRSNDTFVLQGIRSYISHGVPDSLVITPGYEMDQYHGYSVKLLDKHCGCSFEIQAIYKQIGPMYRKVVVESSHRDVTEVTGSGKANIGEDHLITASLKEHSGYGFSHWTRDGVVIPDAGLDYIFRLTNADYNAGDTTSIRYMAHFSQDATARTVFEWTTGGEVTGWQNLGLNIPVGTRFTITATPETGYTFSRWVKSTHATGPVTISREPVYSGRITSGEGATYTAFFESTSQTTSITFNHFVDDFYYDSNTYLTYTDPNGQQQTLHLTTITSYFDIQRDTPVRLHIDIRKGDEYIPCFVEGSDGQRFELSADRQIVVTQEINVRPELENTATITLQAGL